MLLPKRLVILVTEQQVRNIIQGMISEFKVGVKPTDKKGKK